MEALAVVVQDSFQSSSHLPSFRLAAKQVVHHKYDADMPLTHHALEKQFNPQYTKWSNYCDIENYGININIYIYIYTLPRHLARCFGKLFGKQVFGKQFFKLISMASTPDDDNKTLVL